MATKPFEPTQDQRAKVEFMGAIGIPQEHIATIVGIAPHTLTKYFRSELDLGKSKMLAKVAQSLYQKATSEHPQAVTCAIFIMKTQAGWSEKTVQEHVGKDGGPIQFTRIERVVVDPANPDAASVSAAAGAKAL
jgi:hypothetical protein